MDITANQVGIWVLILVALVPAAKVVVDWIKPPQTQRIEQPLEVSRAAEFAPLKHLHTDLQTEIRCESTHKNINTRLDSFSSEIRAALQEHDRKAESRTSDVHERLNNLVTAIASSDSRTAGEIAEVRGALNAHLNNHPRPT
jgi:hypothetical protein